MVQSRMSIMLTLTPEQEGWLQAHVAAGDFASIEEAAQRPLAERIAERVAEQGRAPERQALWVEELSDAELQAIAATEMDPRHDHLNNELR
jgi:antitoxin ParD1/3/4